MYLENILASLVSTSKFGYFERGFALSNPSKKLLSVLIGRDSNKFQARQISFLCERSLPNSG